MDSHSDIDQMRFHASLNYSNSLLTGGKYNFYASIIMLIFTIYLVQPKDLERV
jgi:hypothetical protein